MESCATYLRDTTAVVKAVIAYRQGDIELALEFYNASITQIKKLAAIWGMGFEMFCDLVDEHPEKHRLWDGPFCGGFYSLDKTKPFIGIGFKGTNPSRMGEVLVDWNYQFIQAESGVLFDAHVSTGVYTGLFTKFESAPDTPMALANLAANISTTSSMVHVTGHSLGGSYSTLCFAELLRHSSLGQLPPKCTLGDIYTYGSPRLAQRDLGENYVKYLKNGSSWRIVNDNDLVPQVPPVKPSSVTGIFNHINNGIKIFKDKPPQSLSSELGTSPPPKSWPKTSELYSHQTDAYYAAWKNTTKSLKLSEEMEGNVETSGGCP
ncbi:hypothetical protein FRB94_005893 [Tulasnella sp. JGI-2019a]|nr:hypothetical protein FRB94_005893 [Tulasnella sp. JGI-2019a]